MTVIQYKIRRFATIQSDFGHIGEVKKVDGQKVQKVRIMYNFVGEIPEIAA